MIRAHSKETFVFEAYFNQRHRLAAKRDRILALVDAVDWENDLGAYAWAQFMAVVLEFKPDLIIELGRGRANSTCAFTEAIHMLDTPCRLLSVCISEDWQKTTLPRVEKVVPPDWFNVQTIVNHNILTYDFAPQIEGKKRVILHWDAHGFEVAECVLGKILPKIAADEHLVIMHDISDNRYAHPDTFQYNDRFLWTGNNWDGPRLKLGNIDSVVEQCIAISDFTTRNHLTLFSADHSIHSILDHDKQIRDELQGVLGNRLYQNQAHWRWFCLHEAPGPYTFPKFYPERFFEEKKPAINRFQNPAYLGLRLGSLLGRQQPLAPTEVLTALRQFVGILNQAQAGRSIDAAGLHEAVLPLIVLKIGESWFTGQEGIAVLLESVFAQLTAPTAADTVQAAARKDS